MARQNTANSGGTAGEKLMAQNIAARAAILQSAVNMTQSIASGTIALPGSTNNVINISPRLVGFVKRFWVEIEATVVNLDTVNDLVLTPFGAANLLSQITFTDLSNNIRVQTAGWHLHFVSSVKRNRPHGSVFLNNDPCDMNANYDIMSAPNTIPAGGANTGTVKMIFEVPLTYSDRDFRGGIWLGVTNATATLQLTVNPSPVVAAGSDSVLAMYGNGGSAGGRISSVTYNVYQNYLDQLPVIGSQVILPISDISTVYLLNNTVQQGMVANSDFPIPYANFRDFLSTIAIYDNGGTLNNGSDINAWRLQAANYVNIFNVDPDIVALWTRQQLQADTPSGVYYFDHRAKPISTMQYGNQELVINPASVAANSKLLMGYEQFALVNLVAQAGSLPVV